MVAAQLVTTQLEADDMLRMVAAAFGLAHEGVSKAGLLKNLETFLMARNREGKRVLLVVDEAQNIPPRALEELRMLSNFQVGEKALLQSFLLGQQEFRQTLQGEGMEQLRQRVIAAYHLTPLDADETRSYMEHRLRLVGWAGDPSFSESAYVAIHKATLGVPRRINTFCDRLMLYGFLEEIHVISEKTIEAVSQELLQESPYVGGNAVSGVRRSTSSEPPVEQRLAALEGSVQKLQDSIFRELGMIRRAVAPQSQTDATEDK